MKTVASRFFDSSLRRNTLFLIILVFISVKAGAQRHYSYAKQGFSMKLQMNNLGTFGRSAYPFSQFPPPPDSLGLEYPVGQPIEHIYGAGLWIGGKLDTSQSGTSTPIHLVSVTYEGWSGPYYEFYPGSTSADSIWKVPGRGMPKPSGWDEYWGTSFPYRPIADDNQFCRYTDTSFRVQAHVPLHLGISQSSFTWSDPSAEGIHIIEYRMVNTGTKRIDSVYVGCFLEGDVGPIDFNQYWARNFSAYSGSGRFGYIDNPVDPGSTPVGIALLSFPPTYGSETFRWFPGSQTPSNDIGKYALLQSGIIMPSQYPNLSDTRFLLATGPFTLLAASASQPADTLVFALAVLSAPDLPRLGQAAVRAREIYANDGISLVGFTRGFTQQGFSMRLPMNNRGTLGQAAGSVSSTGLEYPPGRSVGQFSSGGLWVGGLLDTSALGGGVRARRVSQTHDYYSEFRPGPTAGDTIWTTSRRIRNTPSGWSDYWGGALPFHPRSDRDVYCTFSDTSDGILGHFPLGLKVIQASYAWNHPDGEGLIILEYRIINLGERSIDSAYVGILTAPAEIQAPQFYDLVERVGYIAGIQSSFAITYDRHSSPFGVRYLGASQAVDPLRVTCKWFDGSAMPNNDSTKFALLSSGEVTTIADLYGTSFSNSLFSVGPFSLPAHDTLKLAFAVVSGTDIRPFARNLARAKEVYENGVIDPEPVPLPDFQLQQNYPNPFNGFTMIRYSVPTESHVTVKIFSTLGEEVATIVDEVKPPGLHYSAWEAQGRDGTPSASGVYFFRIQASATSGSHEVFRQVKKMVLIR